MRQGRVFRRCTGCGARVEGRRCARCAADTFSWAFVVDVSPPGSTRRVQRRGGGFKTKAQALAALNKLQVDTSEGRHVEPSRLTVEQYLDQWLPGVRGEIRASTFGTYELAIRRLKPLIGDVSLQSLTYPQVRAAYGRLAEGGRVRGGELSAKTVHNVHLCLRRALRDAVRARLIVHNPAETAHRLSTQAQHEMRTWDALELRAFLDSIRAHPLYPLYRLAASTGMRRGELLGLRWSDVILDQAHISVRQQLSRQGDQITFGPVKTRAGRRSISLDQTTVRALRAHREAQAALAEEFGSNRPDGDHLVFARIDGSRHDPDVISQTFDRLVASAKLPRIRLHDLRHTHATLALRAGVHPKVVQERLGHSSSSVTLDLYSHAVPALQEDAADRVADLVDGAEDGTADEG